MNEDKSDKLDAPPTGNRVKKGIVVMLDALGVRTSSSKEASQFLEARDHVLAACEETRRQLDSEGSGATELITFGDTIILCWELSNTATDEVFLPLLGEWLRKMMLSGFHYELLFRGAVAIGEYIHEGATVLGPAIGDAANWYERANWMGVIATPNCGLRLTFLKERMATAKGLETRNATPLLGSWFVEYPVPLVNGSLRTMWAVSWPAQYLFGEPKKKSTRMKAPKSKKVTFSGPELFRLHISSFQIPLGTEDKYSNTVSFFEWFREHVQLRPSDR